MSAENIHQIDLTETAIRCGVCRYDRIIKHNPSIKYPRPPAICPQCQSINTFKYIPRDEASIYAPKQINNPMQMRHPYLDRINGRDMDVKPKVVVTDPRGKKIIPLKRSTTGVCGLDHVTGGGLSEGYVLMIAGPPGAGKSTMTTQAISYIQKYGMHYGPGSAYGSSEEDDDSIIETASRVAEANFKIAHCRDVFDLIDALDSTESYTWAIDSLMEVINPNIEGQPGSPSQVSSCASILYERAKAEGRFKGRPKRTMIIVAHGTKDGNMAGPLKALHSVDGAALLEHVDPNGSESDKRLPWEPVPDQTKPTGYVSLRVYRKMRKASNKRIAYFQLQPEYLDEEKTIKNPIGGRLDRVDGPEWSQD
jgi:predicted ATP-dependent serine protease